jgi:hypothetical protein
VNNRWNSSGKLVVRGKIAVTCYLFGAAPKNAERVGLWIRPCPSNLSERFWAGPFSTSDRSFCQSIAARVSSDNPRLKAFCRVAPSVLFKVRAIVAARVLLFASFFNVRTSFAVQVRLRLFMLWSPRSPKTLYLLLLKKLDLDQIAFFDHTTILAS